MSLFDGKFLENWMIFKLIFNFYIYFECLNKKKKTITLANEINILCAMQSKKKNFKQKDKY